MSQISVLKESWSTDMSPTAVFSLAAVRVQHADGAAGQLSRQGVYPGWCTGRVVGRVYWEGYTGTQSQDHSRTHI